jgi:hypothetical protein
MREPFFEVEVGVDVGLVSAYGMQPKEGVAEGRACPNSVQLKGVKAPPINLGGGVTRGNDPRREGEGRGFRTKTRGVKERRLAQRERKGVNGDAGENGEMLLAGGGAKRVLATFIDGILDGEVGVGVSDECATYEEWGKG